jgi:hypothetical protein
MSDVNVVPKRTGDFVKFNKLFSYLFCTFLSSVRELIVILYYFVNRCKLMHVAQNNFCDETLCSLSHGYTSTSSVMGPRAHRPV